MDTRARAVSWIDILRVQMHLSIPAILLGLVTPNRGVLAFAAKRGAGGGTVRFLRSLRDKYGCGLLWVRFPLRRTLLVMDPVTMDQVLSSTSNAPDPSLKKRAVSRFVPGALVISSTEEACTRRAFNTHVLDLGNLHRHGEAFVRIAIDETARVPMAQTDLRWTDFQQLAERISHQVILGAGENDSVMADHLAHMLPRSNLLLRRRASFALFYERMSRRLARDQHPASTACLMHDVAASLANAAPGDVTRVPEQIGFWFFVLKDALELHVARTLALISAHPAVQARVRKEIEAAGALTAASVDGLRYLEHCIGEQLRLWTAVPMLLRRAEQTFSLGGIDIQAEEQILIHAGAYHRDAQVWGDDADRFSPDNAGSRQGPKSYVFSDHGRGCAGKSLVMLMLKATLASLLRSSSYELVGPRIEPGRIAHLYDHFKIEVRAIPGA